MKFILPLFFTLFMLSCSKHYTLLPDASDPTLIVERDGVKWMKWAGPNCFVSMRFVEDDFEQSFIEIDFKNVGAKPFDFQPTLFWITGPMIPNSPKRALEPKGLLESLTEQSKNLYARSQENTFQGVDTLVNNLPGAEDDADIQAAKSEATKREGEKRREQKLSKKRLEKRARIGKRLVGASMLAPKASARGWIAFPSEFKGRGKINIYSDSEVCPAQLSWIVD